jgi:general secretion pathway protein G
MIKKMWNAKCGRANAGSPKAAGFTLIELLVVIAIIAILAGLILSTAGGIQKMAARNRAEAEVKALEAALESYKADNGDYPLSADYTNNSVTASNSLYKVLCPDTNAANPKVYFEFSKGMTSSSGIVDPFGTVYYYQYPGDADRSGTNFFDLWSTAGNSTNANVWIKNW